MPDASAAKKWDSLVAAGLAAGFLALYGVTLCRSVYWYDSAELVTAAATLGVSHPPGYPLYALVGYLFTWLPVDPALAVNLMSATFAALAVAFVFLVGRQLGLDRGPAAVGAASLGAGGLFWANAVVAEVYCPSVAVGAAVLYLLLRALHEERLSLALWASFLAGLGLGLHMSVATLGLGFALLVWLNGRRLQRMLMAAGAVLAGSLVFAYIPIRASLGAALNICDPSNLGQFAWYLSGGAYRNWFGESSGFFERSLAIAGFFQDQLSWLGLGLAVAGLAWLSRRRPELCLALVLMATGNIVFFFNYQAHDVEVFLLQTTMLLCCFIGAGVQALADEISKVVAPERASRAAPLIGAVLMLLPLQLAYTNYSSADMSGFDETEAFIQAALSELPEGAVILNFSTPDEWKRFAVFGMYAQLVRGERPDVKHLVAPDLRELARSFDPTIPLYVYAPVEMLAHFYDLEPAGPLFRVLAPKPTAAKRAPYIRKTKARTCRTYTALEVSHDH